MKKIFNDAYVFYENGVLEIGNSKIARKIRFENNIPVSEWIKSGNQVWESGNTAMFNVTDYDFSKAELLCDLYISDFGGESEEALVCELIYNTKKASVKQLLYVFPNTCAISSKLYIKGSAKKPDFEEKIVNTAIEIKEETDFSGYVLPSYGVIDSFNMKEKHIKATAVKLSDETDVYNELVISDERMLYGRRFEPVNGSILVLESLTSGKQLMLVSEGYVSGKKFIGDKDFCVNNKKAACVFGMGAEGEFDEYTFLGGATVLCGEDDSVYKSYREAYRKMYNTDEMYIMSNTWGDRNRDTAVCEEFILKEIDVAYKLGVDIVQIDDGWQKGISENSGFTAHGAWGNFYETDADFWSVNKEKFPNGFEVITDYAKERNIRIGLWFSMDKTNSYESWQRDAEKILELHKKHSVCYFKIDGLVMSDHKCESNIYKFVTWLDKESGGKIKFNFDITANRRYGYFIAKQYSTLFVENRYTDWQNYYPYTTLRNLWSLSKYIPSQKMQFEVLNQLRNDEKYGDDILKPSTWPSDYIFASVMVANPLIWMEMTGLNDEQVEMLSKIISVYKKERENLLNADISPIGNRPDGFSYTGFRAEGENIGYLVLLKEKTDENIFTYDVNVKNPEILATNCENVKLSIDDDKLMVKNMNKCGYAFVKYDL